MNTYFQVWMASEDHILSDLAGRFINRKILKSVTFDQESQEDLERLRQLVEAVGFDPDYYTGIHVNFDLPYDIYRPELANPRTQIEMVQQDGSRAELSQLSPIVKALTGTTYGDRRFYFPKEMLELDDLFASSKEAFISYISNGHFHFSN